MTYENSLVETGRVCWFIYAGKTIKVRSIHDTLMVLAGQKFRFLVADTIRKVIFTPKSFFSGCRSNQSPYA